MITQKQIDARDELICYQETYLDDIAQGSIAGGRIKKLKQAIADADKEAADAEFIAMVFDDKPKELQDAEKPIIYNCKNNLYCGASADNPYLCCYSCSQKDGCPYTCKKGISYEECEQNDAEIFTGKQ
jgi:hypothetical protein